MSGFVFKKIQTFLLLFFAAFLFFATPISINFAVSKENNLQLTITQNTAHAGWLDSTFDSIKETVADWVGYGAYSVFIGGGNLFVYYADKLFSNSLYYTLVRFAESYSSTFNLKDPVDKAWTISRDFANLIIIAMFVYAAVGTILRLKDYNLEKFIVKIIIVALLINFSMFMVKFAVDVSNIIAYQFYKEIEKVTDVGKDNKDGMIYIGSVIAKKIGYDEKLYESSREKFTTSTWWWTHFVVMPIIFFVFVFLAGTLLYGSIVMFTRFLGLMLVMALSAVGFVMLIVPSVGNKYFDQWWQSLLKYSLFAPIFSFMLLLIITIISYLGKGQDTNVLLMMANGSWFDALFLPFLMIGLLLAAIKISNSLSIMGSNFASYAALNAMSLATTPFRLPIRGITGRALGAMRKVGLENTGLGLMLAKTYSTAKAPAHSASSLYKNLGIKGLNYDQKSEISSALKEIDATRDGQKGKMEDIGTKTANLIGKGLASVVKKASGVENTAAKETESGDTESGAAKTQHADTSNYQSVVEGGPSAEAQDKEQMRAAERKAEEVAGSINKDLQSESVQFNDLSEAREYAQKILDEKLPENTDAESMERWRQRQFRARRMLKMIDEAGKYPAMKDSVLSSVNDIAKKIDRESKVVAKRFRERDYSGSKDAKTAKFMDKLSKEADQMAEEALDKIEKWAVSRILGGANSNLYKTFISTMEDTSLTPAQKLKLLKDNGMIDTISNAVQSGRLVSADEQSARRTLDKISAAQNILTSKQDPRKIINAKLKRAIDSSSLAAKTKNKLRSIMDDDKKTVTEKLRMINTYAKMTGDNALENTVSELSEYETELRQAAKAEKGGNIFRRKGVKAAFNPYNPRGVDEVRNKAAKKSVWSKVKKVAQKAGEWDKKLFFEEPHGPSESEVLEETLHNLEKLIKDEKVKGDAKKEVEKVFKNAKSKI